MKTHIIIRCFPQISNQCALIRLRGEVTVRYCRVGDDTIGIVENNAWQLLLSWMTQFYELWTSQELVLAYLRQVSL